MIITEYSEQAQKTAKKLAEINQAIESSKWRKKFAWTKVPVSVPGHNDSTIKSYAWLQFYYTRNIYYIEKAEDNYFVTFDIKFKETVNIPSMETLSYAAIEYSEILEQAEQSIHEPDEWKRGRLRTSSVYEVPAPVIALLKKEPFWYRPHRHTEEYGSHRTVYRKMYDSIKGTPLVKGLMTPDEYDKIKLLDRLHEIEV